MDDIRKWFNGDRNYEKGIQLYLKYGTDPILTRLFTVEGYSDFKNQKLQSALDDILAGSPVRDSSNDIAPDPSKFSVISKPTIPSSESNETSWPEVKDEVITSLYSKWKPFYAEMMNLVARIGDIAKAGKNDSSKRKEAGLMAFRILELEDLCDQMYSERNYYLKEGKLSEQNTPIEIASDPSLWYKKLHNHQRYVREYSAALKKNAGDVNKAVLLEKHKWAVSEYKKLLKME